MLARFGKRDAIVSVASIRLLIDDTFADIRARAQTNAYRIASASRRPGESSCVRQSALTPHWGLAADTRPNFAAAHL